MGRAVKDWDVEVFGIDEGALEKLLRTLGPVNTVGKAFGVFKCRPGHTPDEVDVSIPRRDSKTGPGHKGISVEGDPDMSVEEACRRRDLTVNAILYDLDSGAFVDPFNGQEDLARHTLRAVDATTFLEDPLRALRVVQFSARLNFEVHPDLDTLCASAAMEELPVERIRGEWDKLMLSANRPSAGLLVARRTGLLKRVFPEAAAFDDPAHDRTLDRLALTKRPLIEDRGRQLALMLAGWLAGCSAEALEATMNRLGVHKVGGYSTRDQVTALHQHWSDPIDTDSALRRMATRCEVILAFALREARGEFVERRLERAAALGVLTQPEPPLLMGRHLQELGVEPGPHMGELLDAVYEAQINGDIHTLEDALMVAQKRLEAERPS